MQAYLDPSKAEEARQLGNTHFKEGKWVDAIKASGTQPSGRVALVR